MKKWIAALVGAIAGYYCVAYPSCMWFWPESNLCGIYAPVGGVIGAGVAYWIAARKKT
jgi:hypothetical protein